MVFVGQKISSFYQTEFPGSPVEINVLNSLEKLPSTTTCIWQHVGPISSLEKRTLAQRLGSAPQEIAIGIEGALVILNKNNSVTELSVEQLRAIYTGKIVNWKQVGGPDRRIQLYSTESLVGGSMFFQEFVLHGEDIDTTMRGYANPKETVFAVAADAAGIGLTPVAGEPNVKYARVSRGNDSPAVDGTSENIRSLAYPLSSYMYWSIAREYSPAVEQFVEFALSPRGQMAIEASGSYPLNSNQRVIGELALARIKK